MSKAKVLIFKDDDNYDSCEAYIRGCFLVPANFSDKELDEITNKYFDYIKLLDSRYRQDKTNLDKRNGKLKDSVRKKYKNNETYFRVIESLGYEKINFMEI